MPKKHYKKSHKVQQIAKNRINFLFQHAKEVFKEDSNLSDKYVKIARRIAMKHKIRMPSSLKKRFCKNCHKYLVPSNNCRVRIHKHRLIYYCLSCKHYMRHPIKWRIFNALFYWFNPLRNSCAWHCCLYTSQCLAYLLIH